MLFFCHLDTLWQFKWQISQCKWQKQTSENLRAGKKNKFLTIDINDENRFRKAGVQGPESGGWNYPDGLFVGKGGT